MSTTVSISAAATTAFAARNASIWPRLWSALEAHGQRRAAAELRRLGLIHAATNAPLSREMFAVADRVDPA